MTHCRFEDKSSASHVLQLVHSQRSDFHIFFYDTSASHDVPGLDHGAQQVHIGRSCVLCCEDPAGSVCDCRMWALMISDFF